MLLYIITSSNVRINNPRLSNLRAILFLHKAKTLRYSIGIQRSRPRGLRIQIHTSSRKWCRFRQWSWGKLVSAECAVLTISLTSDCSPSSCSAIIQQKLNSWGRAWIVGASINANSTDHISKMNGLVIWSWWNACAIRGKTTNMTQFESPRRVFRCVPLTGSHRRTV